MTNAEEGCPAQFEARYEDIRFQVRVYLDRWFRGRVDVDDVCDEAMTRLYLRWGQIRDPLPWTMAVAKNLVFDELRRTAGTPLADEADADQKWRSILDTAEQVLESADFYQAVSALPRQQRRAVAMRALGYTHGEIAQALNCTRRTVTKYLTSGKRTLKHRLRRS